MTIDQNRRFRPEIQGLRGLAVALVVVFHLWPHALPGGYIGVDVFFVISGYLITGLLAQMALRDGRVSLIEFYSRRIRRLLPAAILVLLVTLLGTLLFISKARWEETANQILASALYVENWRLAHEAVSYLDADNLPTPVQHYWSLSIEEQFYIVWPVLMIGVIWLARRWHLSLRRCLATTLSLVFLASLAASVILTKTDSAQAYFVSHTRLWELALGGLLVLGEHRFRLGAGASRVMALAGTAGILASALLFSAATPFPGLSALLPTLATVLIILAGEVQAGRFRGLDLWPLRFIGDRSYSIYLWHWPLITFFLGQGFSLTFASGAGLIAVTVVLSDLSYRYVEQPCRQSRGAWWKPLGYGTIAVLACVAASEGLLHFVTTQRTDITLIGTPAYPGPAALLTGAAVPDDVDLLPPLARLRRDVSRLFSAGCQQNLKGAKPVGCVLGDPAGPKTIVLVGDSHAAQWGPALNKIARDRKYKLVSFSKSACAFARAPTKSDGKPYPSCYEWREKVLAEILKLRPLAVITSQSNAGSVPDDLMIEGLRNVWSELTEAGPQIIVIRNTPLMRFEPGDCLSATPAKCFTKRSDAELNNLLALAAEGQKNVRVVDMTDALCGPELCPAVVGNMIVWRDTGHLTATYSLALAPYLAPRLGL
ncbi:acyltransferase family protein [Mesorhizobium sp. LNJC405B00]|uniref:acyltransferase family protein n=1 Tax=unclassified Mesorhizobium TaxID=325217 RepID=UPI000A000EEB|nr:acyltransferase family protein [Mesorhizobium sp. LNJC405B00]